MDKIAKKIKSIVKGVAAPATYGKDPNDPWSAKANIAESGDSMLNAFLKSRGINPNFISKETKISHAKSLAFLKWKKDHMFEDVQSESMTMKHTPTELRQHALKKSTHMNKVTVSAVKPAGGLAPGLTAEEVDKEDTITFDIPLLIRMLEYAKEDAKTDMDLHKVTEKLISIRNKGTLTMADYDFVVKLKENFNLDEGAFKRMATDREEDARLKKMSSLEKFRAAAAEREKKHAEIAKHSGGMTAAIDRLEKHLNREEVVNEHGDPWERDQHGKSVGWKAKEADKEIKAMRADAKKYPHGNPNVKLMKVSDVVKSAHKSMNKEETEQIDEISKSTLASYKDKSTASLKNAQSNRDAAEAGKHMSKGFADLHKKSDEIAKKRVKGLKGYLQRKVGMKPTSEDVFADSQAATQSNFDGANAPDNTEPRMPGLKKEMSKSARIIKSIYKRKNMKEELYDGEKEDKSVATYGKKPKMKTTEVQQSYGDSAPQAAAVLSGGKTLTGQSRDTLEIDPMMRRPLRPDQKQPNKKR